MPLTFSFEKIENADEVCFVDAPEGGKVHRPVTEALIWKTMSIGIGQITEKNAGEFYARVHLVEQLDGASLMMPNEDGDIVPTGISADDIRRHIGLETNATYKVESRGTWLNRICGLELDASKRHYELLAKQPAETAEATS